MTWWRMSSKKWNDSCTVTTCLSAYLSINFVLIWWHLRHVSPTIFARYSNSMETLPRCNSVAGHQIATIFCKICKILLRSCIRLEVRVKRYFHQIWIAMENPLVKRGPGYYFPEPNKQLTLSSPCITFCLHDDVIKWKHFPRHWPFVREFTGDGWIPRTKASDAELWCFLWSASELTVE